MSVSGKAKTIHQWLVKYAKSTGVSSISSKEISQIIERAYWGAINPNRYMDAKNKRTFRKLVFVALRSHASWIDRYDSYVVDVLFNRLGISDPEAKKGLRDAILTYHCKSPKDYCFNPYGLAIDPEMGSITLFTDPLPNIYESAIELYAPVWRGRERGSVWLLDKTNPADVRTELHKYGVPLLSVNCIDESTSEMPDMIFSSGYEKVFVAVVESMGEYDLIGGRTDTEYSAVFYQLVRERCRLIVEYREPQLLSDFSFAEFQSCCFKHGLYDALDKFNESIKGSGDKELLHALMMDDVKPFFSALESLYPRGSKRIRGIRDRVMAGEHFVFSFKCEITMMLVSQLLHGMMGDDVPYEYGASYQVFVEVQRSARFAMWFPSQRRGIPFNWNLFYPVEFDEQSSASVEDYESQLREMIGWVDTFVVSHLHHHETPVKNAIREEVANGDIRADLVILR